MQDEDALLIPGRAIAVRSALATGTFTAGSATPVIATAVSVACGELTLALSTAFLPAAALAAGSAAPVIAALPIDAVGNTSIVVPVGVPRSVVRVAGPHGQQAEKNREGT